MLPGTKGKIAKGKKPAVQFAAENVDNTAPVPKILRDFNAQNSSALDFYCQVLRPRPSTSNSVKSDYDFTLTGHPLFAFPDDWDGGLNSGYFESFPYKSMLPRMLKPLQNIGKDDPVTSLLKEKQDWHYRNRIYTSRIKAAQSGAKLTHLNEEVVECPKFMVDLAAHLDNEPHPDFDESYNWYYAGNGNLQLFQMGSEEYLLHSEFNMLHLSNFSKTDLQISTNYAATYDCGEGNLILETICSANDIVALRTKHKVFILKIVSTNDTIEIEKIKSIESEITYTGISFDNHHKNILYVTSLDNTVKIINLDRLTARTVTLAKKAKPMCNNWNTVISSDRFIYTHVTKKGIELYDKRTNKETVCWKNLKDVSDFNNCNEITAAMHREGSTSLYCGTDHHLFMFDLRHVLKTKPKPVLRWTHGMQCVPTYLSICNFDYNKELVSLCSQWCEDTCVVPNYVSNAIKEETISGVTVPYRPPSILHTLQQAREKRLCYDLYNPIIERLSTSITGQIVLEQDENYVILMQNSFGDISCHTLYPEHMETVIEDKGIEHLDEWSKAYKKERETFEVTEIKNIATIWKALKVVPDDYKFYRTRVKKSNRERKQKEVIEMFEKEGLDPGLLDIWTDNFNDTTAVENSSLAIDLHYSEDYDEDEN